MEKISIIVPCYNEETALPLFYEELQKNIKSFGNNVSFEILFVNDGSKDHTLSVIKDLAKKDSNIKFISFSRNFGKESAIYAGLENSTGDYVVMMDADLQDPPSLLKEMYKAVTEDKYDAVGTRRVNRKGEPIIRSFFAKLFYKIINKMTPFEMVDGARDFVFMKRVVVEAILSLKEYNRYSKGLFSFEYQNVQRVAGTTKWSFWKLTKYALEGITAFSTTPLLISSGIGILFCAIAFIMILVIIFKTIILGDPTSGWPSLACIIFMVSGLQMFSLGIIGQYLSKTYLEVKKRPLYFIKDTNIENK